MSVLDLGVNVDSLQIYENFACIIKLWRGKNSIFKKAFGVHLNDPQSLSSPPSGEGKHSLPIHI